MQIVGTGEAGRGNIGRMVRRGKMGCTVRRGKEGERRGGGREIRGVRGEVRFKR